MKGFEIQAREDQDYHKKRLTAILVGTQTRMLIEMRRVKAILMKFHKEMRSLLRIGLVAIHVTSRQRTCLHFAHDLNV